MNKFIFTLFVCGSSLAAVILFANTAFATPLVTENFHPTFPIAPTQLVNINQANPHLISVFKQSDPLQEHLGCSCAICSGIQQFN